MVAAVPVNYLAVLACGVVSMILGSLWYGPLFGKQWQAMSGLTADKMAEAKKKGMFKPYALMFVGSLVMAFVLAHANTFASAYLKQTTILSSLQGAFWNWLGFIAPVTLGKVLWDGKPWKLWLLDNGYYLVLLGLMSMILMAWK